MANHHYSVNYTAMNGEIVSYQMVPKIPDKEIFSKLDFPAPEPAPEPAPDMVPKTLKKKLEDELDIRERSTIEVVHGLPPWDGLYIDADDEKEPTKEEMEKCVAAAAAAKLVRQKWVVEEKRRAKAEKEKAATEICHPATKQ
ncbi:uncharacterized protein BP5553_05171 [Venustampulla echinocandica]|uniref:Uncharacterized protein n=1 Tax=Venustampulla echinocandica TaxID=2656787 RepID=A0A370TQE4_9HELO|nr:uncharacterized protein BP5553_05171 [Venustampulla echinocandica]RDL37738.1 hypothetical protein BP5553_05171 [Venustampulla echinocandica]